MHHSQFLTHPIFYCIFLYQNYFRLSCWVFFPQLFQVAELGPSGIFYPKGTWRACPHTRSLWAECEQVRIAQIWGYIFTWQKKKKKKNPSWISLLEYNNILRCNGYRGTLGCLLNWLPLSCQLNVPAVIHSKRSLTAVGFLSRHEVQATTQRKLRANNNCWRAVTPNALRKHVCASCTVEIIH